MKIKHLVIENFKSIERIELIEPNPFTVFVGPNGSGKSNIFEALEFVNISQHLPEDVNNLFGGNKALLNRKSRNPSFRFSVDIDSFTVTISDYFSNDRIFSFDDIDTNKRNLNEHLGYQQFYNAFTRLFIDNQKLVKLPYNGDQRLSLSAQNLEKVLKRILTNRVLRDEIFEWLELFVPGFKAIEVDDRNELHWFEESILSYFTKDLISDGTYNILALLTAVYQSEEPQFLCIEEPENGLHPQVLMTLVDFFRKQCEEKGHYIWLNTHSESLVRCLTTDEIVLVNKKKGATKIKQIKGRNLYDIPTDEAWLTGALGGGLPW